MGKISTLSTRGRLSRSHWHQIQTKEPTIGCCIREKWFNPQGHTTCIVYLQNCRTHGVAHHLNSQQISWSCWIPKGKQTGTYPLSILSDSCNSSWLMPYMYHRECVAMSLLLDFFQCCRMMKVQRNMELGNVPTQENSATCGAILSAVNECDTKTTFLL